MKSNKKASAIVWIISATLIIALIGGTIVLFTQAGKEKCADANGNEQLCIELSEKTNLTCEYVGDKCQEISNIGGKNLDKPNEKSSVSEDEDLKINEHLTNSKYFLNIKFSQPPVSGAQSTIISDDFGGAWVKSGSTKTGALLSAKIPGSSDDRKTIDLKIAVNPGENGQFPAILSINQNPSTYHYNSQKNSPDDGCLVEIIQTVSNSNSFATFYDIEGTGTCYAPLKNILDSSEEISVIEEFTFKANALSN